MPTPQIQPPREINAGSDYTWTQHFDAYPAGTYTLKWTAMSATDVYTISGTASGTDHVMTLDHATTIAYTPGRYHWATYVEDAAGNRYDIASGALKINPDPAGHAVDRRTHARKMLDAIEALLEGRATAGQVDMVKAYWGHRRVDPDPAQLIPLRDRYRGEVAAEERAARIAAGEKLQNKVKVRF